LIVVSDTSPILNLAAIGRADLLAEVYGTVLIPPAVATELRRHGFQTPGAGWLEVKPLGDEALVRRLRANLDAGESEAIALALEQRADRLLIDERRGRKIACAAGLSVVGLLGVLAEAKDRGLIRLCKPLLDEIIEEAGFWIGATLYRRFLDEMGEQ
jgi:predicted nucleic acid-binding protein